MISIRNLSKWYGAFQVLADCSTEVAKGEVVVVCGPSGSGKSTLIKCVNALEPFQKGTVLVDGVSVGDPKTNLPKLRSRIGMVFQNFELFPHLSVTENLTLAQVKVLGRTEEAARDMIGSVRTDRPSFRSSNTTSLTCMYADTPSGIPMMRDMRVKLPFTASEFTTMRPLASRMKNSVTASACFLSSTWNFPRFRRIFAAGESTLPPIQRSDVSPTISSPMKLR